MARTFKAGVLITGDSKGAVQAINLTEKEVANLDKTTAKARKNHAEASKSITDGFGAMASKAAVWGAAAIAAGTAVTAGLVKSGLESVDALAKTADKLGVATDALASMRYAAGLTGVEVGTFDKSIEKLAIRVSEAAAGTGTAAKSFDALGISATELIKLPLDKQMGVIADKINNVENASQKAKIAYDIFGRSGVDLINTLALGSDGLAAMAEEAEVLGITLSRVDAAKVEAANDAMSRIGTAVEGLGQQLAVKFAPLLQVIADKLFGVAKEAGGMGEVASTVFSSMTKWAGYLGDAITALQVSWKLMKVTFQEAALVIIDGMESLLKGAIDMYNRLPWVDPITYTADLRGFALTMESEIRQGREEIDAILSKPLPSDAMENFSIDVQRAYTEAADVAVVSQEEIQSAVISTEDVTKSLATTTAATTVKVKESTEQIAGFWADSRDLLSGFFFEMAADGKNAFETLFDGFKAMLSKMVAEAAANQIFIGVGATLGLGGVSGAASAASAAGSAGSLLSGGGSLLSMLSGGASAALGGLGGVYTGVGNFFGAGSAIGNSALDIGRGYSYGSIGQGLGQLGLNLGAGVLGGFAGNAIFGNTTGIGSTLGGVAGSVFGPLGTGVGSFLGSGAERLLGNVLGFGGNGGNHAGRADLNLATGNLNSYGVGKKFDQANVDAAQGLAQALGTFSEIIGGSSAKFGITVGNRSGIASDGRKYDTSEEFLADSFDRILASATNLDPVLKSLIAGFDGTAEQMQLFAASVISLSQQSGVNTVTQAIEDFARVQPTVTQAYVDQTDSLASLITNFDGSAYAAAELSDALAINKTAAYEMAIAIQQIGQQIGLLAEDQVRYIRESVMTEEELRASRARERNELRAGLSSLIDPAEIDQTSRRILELNKQIFDSLSEDAQLQRADAFANYAESTATVTENILQRSLDSLKNTQDKINQEVSNMLQSAAQGQQQAANTQLNAANIIMQAANQLLQVSNKQSGGSGLVLA